MNKEKLDREARFAAYQYANPDEDTPCYDVTFYKGFKRGAEWLIQQPLSDRLTDDEKQHISEFMNAETGALDAIDAVEFVEQLFGEELFN